MSPCQFIICTCWICLGSRHAQFLISYWNILVQTASQENSPGFLLAAGASMMGDLRFRVFLLSYMMDQGLNSKLWGKKESVHLKKLSGKPGKEIIDNPWFYSVSLGLSVSSSNPICVLKINPILLNWTWVQFTQSLFFCTTFQIFQCDVIHHGKPVYQVNFNQVPWCQFHKGENPCCQSSVDVSRQYTYHFTLTSPHWFPGFSKVINNGQCLS